MPHTVTERGFFRTLFDLSFEHFVVVRVVRWFYFLVLCAAAMGFLVMIVTGISGLVSAQNDINALVGAEYMSAPLLAGAQMRRAVSIGMISAAPFVAALAVLVGRVAAEMTIVLFSITESLKLR